MKGSVIVSPVVVVVAMVVAAEDLGWAGDVMLPSCLNIPVSIL